MAATAHIKEELANNESGKVDNYWNLELQSLTISSGRKFMPQKVSLITFVSFRKSAYAPLMFDLDLVSK